MEKKERKNRKVKKKICVWENETEWLKKKRKRKREEEWQERYERDESSERKIKCKERCHVVERRNFHSFSNYVQSDNEDVISASYIFSLPLHMSTILYLIILDIPTYGLFSWLLALKGKQPLEEVLNLTILVLIVLAIPIAPLYMLYETFMGGESFIKIF
jgi:hypothetical protein